MKRTSSPKTSRYLVTETAVVFSIVTYISGLFYYDLTKHSLVGEGLSGKLVSVD